MLKVPLKTKDDSVRKHFHIFGIAEEHRNWYIFNRGAKMKKFRALSLFIVFLTVLTQCGVYRKYTPLISEVFPPAASVALVEVFMSDKPSKAYVEIGQIEVYEGGDSILIARQEAAKRGANAIVYIGSQAYGQVAVAPGVAGTANKMVFIAVRYR